MIRGQADRRCTGFRDLIRMILQRLPLDSLEIVEPQAEMSTPAGRLG